MPVAAVAPRPAVFNAANEQAVALFLAGSIRFADIAASIDSALKHLGDLPSATREELLDADSRARRHVMESFGCLAWVAPLIVFGIVVFVHELGHFLAATAVGVYTPRFSIGFGKALWKKRYGETEYVLAALHSAATSAWRRRMTRPRRSSRAAAKTPRLQSRPREKSSIRGDDSVRPKPIPRTAGSSHSRYGRGS
jgi:hypothetical protein